MDSKSPIVKAPVTGKMSTVSRIVGVTFRVCFILFILLICISLMIKAFQVSILAGIGSIPCCIIGFILFGPAKITWEAWMLYKGQELPQEEKDWGPPPPTYL